MSTVFESPMEMVVQSGVVQCTPQQQTNGNDPNGTLSAMNQSMESVNNLGDEEVGVLP